MTDQNITSVPIISEIRYVGDSGHHRGVTMRFADVTFTFGQGGKERSITLGMFLPLNGDQSAAAYEKFKEICAELTQAISERMDYNDHFKKA